MRHGFLWLVGAKGSETQIKRATLQTERWLNRHGKDDFIRVGYLLFLIRRTAKPRQRKQAIAKTRKWLDTHPDDYYGFTDLALRLCESAADV